MKQTLQNSLLTLLVISSFASAKPYNNLAFINANSSVTITDFDQGDNGEV